MTGTTFTSPDTLDDALAALAEHGAGATVLAGGTDVMVQVHHRLISPTAIVHIGRLASLRALSCNGRTTIGALVTHTTLRADAGIQAGHPALSQAAATIGGWQTQNAGTLGGNIVNASPAADTVPALLVAAAEVELRTATGTRTLPLHEFLLDRKQTALDPGELLTAVTLEPRRERTGEAYVKVGRRRAMEVAQIGLAARISFAENGTADDVRIAVCSVAPVPYRASAVEAALRGTRLTDDIVREAGRLLQESATPIDDARAPARYRLAILPTVLAQAVADCRHGAGL